MFCKHSYKRKEAFESKYLNVNPGKTTVIVSGSITLDGLSKSKLDLYGICTLRVKANSVLCVQCGKRIYCRCAGVRRLTPQFSRYFTW